MTNATTKTTLAIFALGLSVPAMAATDGDPGVTSSGNFNVSVAVNPPLAVNVQVLGLQDVTFSQIQLPLVSGLPTESIPRQLCLKRSAAGPLTVAMTYSEPALPGNQFALRNGNADGTGITVQFDLLPYGGTSIQGFRTVTVQHDGNDCSAANPNFELLTRTNTLVGEGSTVINGNYTGTFTLTLSTPS